MKQDIKIELETKNSGDRTEVPEVGFFCKKIRRMVLMMSQYYFALLNRDYNCQ